jgi:hypothetical protein
LARPKAQTIVIPPKGKGFFFLKREIKAIVPLSGKAKQ